MITSELEEEPFCKDTLQTLETMPAPPPREIPTAS